VQLCSNTGPNAQNQIRPWATLVCIKLSGLDNSLAIHGSLAIPLKNGNGCFKIWLTLQDTKPQLQATLALRPQVANPWCTVQDPEFGIQSARILGILWIWIGYLFPFNRIRIIQMKEPWL